MVLSQCHGLSRQPVAMGRRCSARQYGQIVHRVKTTSVRPTTTTAATPSQDTSAQGPDDERCILELPHDVLIVITLKLSFGDALAFGSTCNALHQCLSSVRTTALQNFLKSEELAPRIQLKTISHGDLMPVGLVQLYFSWSVRASHLLFKLAVQEQVAPGILWSSIIPRTPMDKAKGLLSVRCSFGCLEWVSGSLHEQNGEVSLCYHLAKSDVERLNRQFNTLKDLFVNDGAHEECISVSLGKHEPHVARQRDAALLLHWVDNHLIASPILPGRSSVHQSVF